MNKPQDTNLQPLAARMRPERLRDYIGQTHLVGPGKPLRSAIESGHLHSMILWGPPGTGKTTLARLIANEANAAVASLSAVSAGVKDIRQAMEAALFRQQQTQQATVLFIDEIHRFNKSQQDALLPYVEDGTVTLIGSTTENPSFELNNALLSRARVYVLKRLSHEELLAVIQQALEDKTRGFGEMAIAFPQPLQETLAQYADGDARQCLNMLEVLIDFSLGMDPAVKPRDDNDAEDPTPKKRDDNDAINSTSISQDDNTQPSSSPAKAGDPPVSLSIQENTLNEVLAYHVRRFDKGGDYFYDLISALHKSMRGSDPDASLYWFARMLDGGCDPLYIARRVVRFASEDIGNADPRALTLALNAWDVQERLGSPEGELAIAQAIIYLACAAKSNASYMAFKAAMAEAKTFGTQEVPIHLRNAPTKLMKELGHGKAYRYAHDEPHGYAAGEHYFPDDMKPRRYYQPVDRGLEKQIKEKLAFLETLDQNNG